MERKLLTRSEVATVLGVSYQRVCQLHRLGRLKPANARTAGRGCKYASDDVMKLQEARKNSGGNAGEAFRLFRSGATPVDVVIQLNMSPDVVKELYSQFKTLDGSLAAITEILQPLFQIGYRGDLKGVPAFVQRLLTKLRLSSAVIRRHDLTTELATMEASGNDNDQPIAL